MQRSSFYRRERYRALNRPDRLSGRRIQVETCRGKSFFDLRAQRTKVFLLEDEDELRKMGGVRLAKAGTDYPQRITDLLGIVDRSLADSKVKAVSTDRRFIAAFNAALCAATTALRASGHRTVTQAGHHVKTIESLELTVKANPKLIQRFKTFNNKRNKSVYDLV